MTNLPLHHLSIRVPWHDQGWGGTICANPIGNSACLRLANVHDRRNDAQELRLAGSSMSDLAPAELPPCIAERATFMAPFSITRQIKHPYHGTSKVHAHYLPTPIEIPPYSAGCVPFRWLLRENAAEIAQTLDLVYHDEAEVRIRELMGRRFCLLVSGRDGV